MTRPLVSVVMPVHNGAGTLDEAVQSILNQSLRELELIIVDDGSTDATPEIIADHSLRDDRLRCLGQSRKGIVDALQHGCSAARGEYIARMDADDVAALTRLDLQVQAFADDKELALCGTGVEMIGDVGEGRARYAKWINRLINHDDIMRERFIECPIAHPAFMMKRDAFDRVGGYHDRGWAEDYDLFLRFAEAGARFHNVAEPLLQWRESRDRLSMNDTRYSLESFRACKRHYLGQSVLANYRPFYQWGAGAVGKAWLREWGDHKPIAAVDLNPKKIGEEIHGVPIITPDDLPRDALTLVAVGAPGARKKIRAWFTDRGHEEARDFFFIA